jgi:hypothetical protein
LSKAFFEGFFLVDELPFLPRLTRFPLALVALLLVDSILLRDLSVGFAQQVALRDVDVHDVRVEVVTAVHARTKVQVAKRCVGLVMPDYLGVVFCDGVLGGVKSMRYLMRSISQC